MRTQAQAVENAGRAYAQLLATVWAMTPREQAEAAWTPTTGISVNALEDRIRVKRGLPVLHRAA